MQCANRTRHHDKTVHACLEFIAAEATLAHATLSFSTCSHAVSLTYRTDTSGADARGKSLSSANIGKDGTITVTGCKRTGAGSWDDRKGRTH